MKIVLQRVTHASVLIEEEIKGEIKQGLLVLVGIENADTELDAVWLSNKIVNMRIFNNDDKVMSLSLKDVDGDILLVSQFTLHASTKKGARPSYIKAAKADVAIPLYQKMIQQLEHDLGKEIQTGEFGADMRVSLENDGPVTILVDSQNRV